MAVGSGKVYDGGFFYVFVNECCQLSLLDLPLNIMAENRCNEKKKCEAHIRHANMHNYIELHEGFIPSFCGHSLVCTVPSYFLTQNL